MNKRQFQFNQSNTIDEQHTVLMEKFREIEYIEIPNLLEERNILKKKVKHMKYEEIENKMLILDQIKDIELQVKRLRMKKKEYFLETSKDLFKYFEDKKKISNGDNNKNLNRLNSFFKIKDASNATVEIKQNSYSKYWKFVKNEIPNIQNFVVPSDICHFCRQGEMIPQEDEGIVICNNAECSKFISYIVDNSKPNKEPPNEVSYTAYIRLNHFKEILSQFQAKETTQIPEEVFDAIRRRIQKERIQNIKEINYEKMRDILRILGLNKYFEHIQYINSIIGIKPPVMSEELIETLCVLFIEIQGPWAIHCPPNRTNFFNYTYILYQLCTLLDQLQYLPYIQLLKDRTKQLEQDMTWEKVCKDLDWLFIPTV